MHVDPDLYGSSPGEHCKGNLLFITDLVKWPLCI